MFYGRAGSFTSTSRALTFEDAMFTRSGGEISSTKICLPILGAIHLLLCTSSSYICNNKQRTFPLYIYCTYVHEENMFAERKSLCLQFSKVQ